MLTAKDLFEAYLTNNTNMLRGYELFDIIITDDFSEYTSIDRLWGFMIYKESETYSKKGKIIIYSASDEYGIVEEDEQYNIDNVEKFDLYYDFDIGEIVTEERLKRSYCHQFIDGQIAYNMSYTEWRERLLKENLKRIL